MDARAEGMGFEPTTPYGASDFESDRWPIRLPSGVQLARSELESLNLAPNGLTGNDGGLMTNDQGWLVVSGGPI